MFSDKLKKRIAGLALAGAALAIAPSAASAGVVVKSTGPSSSSYPVGRQISDRATITLRSGDRITVLTESGTRVMSGPGTFRVGEGATRTRTRFSTLTRRNATTRARPGAIRGDGPAAIPRSPNLWFVNLAASGNICLYDFDRIRLWRPDASVAQTFTIADEAGEVSFEIPFGEKVTMQALNSEGIPVTAGTNYTISASAQEGAEAQSVTVNFVTLTEEYATPATLAQALFDSGCSEQFNLLADSLEAAAQ